VPLQQTNLYNSSVREDKKSDWLTKVLIKCVGNRCSNAQSLSTCNFLAFRSKWEEIMCVYVCGPGDRMNHLVYFPSHGIVCTILNLNWFLFVPSMKPQLPHSKCQGNPIPIPIEFNPLPCSLQYPLLSI